MKILIVGSGAREHAIAKALQRSPQNPVIFCYGNSQNPGIQSISKNYQVGSLTAAESILAMAKTCHVDMAIIGPEAPLAHGIADVLWDNHIPTIGPRKKLAQIETSKAFTRRLLKKYRIQGSLEFCEFHNMEGVRDFLEYLGPHGYVIKADGLMGGKGVKVAGEHLHSFDEAYQFCQNLYEEKRFSIGLMSPPGVTAGSSEPAFIIEEKIIGQEFSLMCFCDGNTLVPMPIVQDHKRAFEGDQGPNTGGMGSYSHFCHGMPFLTKDNINEAQQINESVLQALNSEFTEKYIGILYGSFMITQQGVRLIEYNARFGDPEAINVLSVLKSDFVSICQTLVSGSLSKINIQFDELATVCKYIVPEGYPDNPIQNALIDISGIQNPKNIYYASINVHEGKLYTTSSRSIAIISAAKTISDAEKTVESEIGCVRGKLFHRADIGRKASMYEK